MLENNHTKVWGSWYDAEAAEWGYGCCHSKVWNSYCTGLAGIEASKATFNPAPAKTEKDEKEKHTKTRDKAEQT